MGYRSTLPNGYRVVVLEERKNKIIGACSNKSGDWGLICWYPDGRCFNDVPGYRLIKQHDIGDYVTVLQSYRDPGDRSFQGVLLRVLRVDDEGYEVRCFEGGRAGDYFLDYNWDVVKATPENVTNPLAKELLRSLSKELL